MEKVFIRRGDKVVGPTTRENLLKLRETRKVTDADQVSIDQKNWMSLGDFLKPGDESAQDTDVEESGAEPQNDDYEDEQDQNEPEDSSVNISSKNQEKAMWTVTLVVGLGGAGVCALAFVLGFIFGFFPDRKLSVDKINPRMNQGGVFINR